MNDKTLVSELEYLIDLNLIDHPEVHSLVLRSITALKYYKKDVERLNQRISNLQWKDAICTGSY